MSSPRRQRRIDAALAARLGSRGAVRAYAAGRANLRLSAACKPRRGCAVTDAGVLLLSTRVARHVPKTVLTEVPHGALFPPNISAAGRKAVRVNLGAEVVRLRRVDYERLTAVVADGEKGPIVAIPDGRMV